jgi:hypothetical protein
MLPSTAADAAEAAGMHASAALHLAARDSAALFVDLAAVSAAPSASRGGSVHASVSSVAATIASVLDELPSDNVASAAASATPSAAASATPSASAALARRWAFSRLRAAPTPATAASIQYFVSSWRY